MRTRVAVATLVLVASGCAGKIRPTPVLPPLGGDGEVHVYALPLSRDAERLSFTITSVALVRQDGTEVPLEVRNAELVGSGPPHQQLLASGRVTPGEYGGFVVRAGAATLESDGDRSRLLVEPESAPAPLALRLDPGTAAVVWATLDASRSVRGAYAFAPVFTARLAPLTPPQVTLYCTSTAWASVTAIDLGARLVSGVIPVGAAPRGIAIDRAASRGYVALTGEDQLEILDLAAGRSMGRVRLSPGDGPTDVAIARDGTILVVNARSRTVSFVDAASMAELGRVPVGEAPASLRVDRSGPRAYVANRGSASVTVLDVPSRTMAGTIATAPEPVWAEVSRDGTQLYVVSRGSAYLQVFSLPDLAAKAQPYVGIGATSVLVDPRTDLLYISRAGERRITAYDPIAFQPVDRFEVPGPVSRMEIDDVRNTVLALMPERRSIAVLDLTNRKLQDELPVGGDPYSFAFIGVRF
jgi:DNA-binding beta-propeller fold protein YncE